jgi:hypothetical protein
MDDPAMKKLLIASCLSIATLGLIAGQAPAWCFLGCHRCCFDYCICCRPYNAFSPVCFGNINCCGCCPVANFGMNGCGPMACGYPTAGEVAMAQLPPTDQSVASAVPFQAPTNLVPGPNTMGYNLPLVTERYTGYAPAYYPAVQMMQNSMPTGYWNGGN